MTNPVKALKRTSEIYKTLDAKDRRRFWTDMLLNNAIYIILVIFLIYTYIRNNNLATLGSVTNILSLAAASLPMALGIGGCIVLTGTDLSAGRVVGLTAGVSASLLQATDYINKFYKGLGEVPIFLVLILALIIGGIVGLVNGFFVAKFQLHPFIVTLATQLIVYGLCLLYYMMNGNNGQPLSGLAENYRNFINGSLIGDLTGGALVLPNYVIYAVILLVIMWFIWNKTPFGKNMFAVGSNAEAANVSGVNVFMTTVMVHALAGMTYGYTGFVDAARVASNNPGTGLNAESDAIAACVIGGVSFVGGTGTIGGVVLGVFVLRIIFVGLNYLAIDSNMQYVIKGAIILLACSIDMRKYLARK